MTYRSHPFIHFTRSIAHLSSIIKKKAMILKTLTQREDAEHNQSDCWTFHDNIESARVYFDGTIKASCVALHFKGTEGEIVIALHDVAYLCNDAGKTIERLGPAATRTAHKAMYPHPQ